jgi:NAD(P)H-dependent flavin oxidoreductase YrpB (nitropropane dioxygenase family)
VKQFLVANDERATNLIFRNLHNTARVAKNSVSNQVVGLLSQPGAMFEHVAHLVRGIKGREVLETGNLDAGLVWAGLSQALIHDTPSVAELIARIVTEAESVIADRLQRLVTHSR